MKPITKKMRQWFLGSALIITSVLVWWASVYSDLQDNREILAADVSQFSHERDRLKQKVKELSGNKRNHREMEETLARFSGLLVQGNSIEAVSAQTQLWVQEFLAKYDLSLKTYKGLSPSKWKDYPLSRVQFQLGTNTQGLSDLLENLETLGKAVRIEKLGVNYRRSRENDLRVSLHLGTLYVEGHKE